jgi:hypothetical protein
MICVSPHLQLSIVLRASADHTAAEKEGVEIKINPETQHLNW